MTELVIEGDCLAVMAEMADGTVDAVITDPPYGMAYRSNKRTATPKFDAIQNDADYDEAWQLSWMRECYRLLKPDRHFYAFCNDLHLGDFRATARDAGFTVKRTLVWEKDGFAMGDLTGDYAHLTEFIVFAHKGQRELFHGRHPNIIRARKTPPGQMQHPTEKPTRVIRPLILNSTHHGEVVLDPFAGSGATGVAAREEGRGFILIEQHPKYIQVVNERLAQGNLF